MSDLSECRLLIDPPGPGAWNMAVDELLLDWSAEQGCCCWRFYGWDEPTLSLGYFQSYQDRLQHAPSRDCPTVRRLTGGGAILHDAELTYSLVVPGKHPLAARRNLLYEAVHTSLINALADLGVAATLYQRSGLREQAPPLLCFQRRAPGDLLVGPVKIAGSAQRRRRGAVLQHGSVLLRRSAAAPELVALEDLAGKALPKDYLATTWLRELSSRLGLKWCREALSDRQRRRAATLAESRYASARWTENRFDCKGESWYDARRSL